MKFRADRKDGEGKVEGFYRYFSTYALHQIIFENEHSTTGISQSTADIKPETLEIFLFGEWILVSELETKYKLVEIKESFPELEETLFDEEELSIDEMVHSYNTSYLLKQKKIDCQRRKT